MNPLNKTNKESPRQTKSLSIKSVHRYPFPKYTDKQHTSVNSHYYQWVILEFKCLQNNETFVITQATKISLQFFLS